MKLPTQIKKEQLQAGVKAAENPVTPQGDITNILALANQWAELHAKPKTREKMDDLIANLTDENKRKVILCGQRIAAGLPPKIPQ